MSRSVSTTEPESGFDTISLELARSAAYGRATVSWAVVLVTADGDDLGTSTGVDTIEDGKCGWRGFCRVCRGGCNYKILL